MGLCYDYRRNDKGVDKIRSRADLCSSCFLACARGAQGFCTSRHRARGAFAGVLCWSFLPKPCSLWLKALMAFQGIGPLSRF